MYEKEERLWFDVEFVSLCCFSVPDYSLWFSFLKLLLCPASEACVDDRRPSYIPLAFDEPENHKEDHVILIPPR